ncbi:MAG: hypothetical protein IMY73_01115, partial [Bacteroidetes bacterium]|nr:hypothetical protein [Bacteroidota bacterium]
MKNLLSILSLIFLILMSSCEKDPNTKIPENITEGDIYGVIQKGPFVRGSKVTITELDKNLNMTGKTYTTQI